MFRRAGRVSSYCLAAVLVFILNRGSRDTVAQPSEPTVDGVTEVAFGPDGTTIASGREDTRIAIWNTTFSALKAVLEEHCKFVNALLIDPSKGRTELPVSCGR